MNDSPSTATLTGGEALVAALSVHGVTDLFGIPGTHNLPVYSHLSAYGIVPFSPRHEQGAGYAADGYARATGRPGVCLTTTGPALLNAATAAAQAYSDSVPVLFVSPGMPSDHPGRDNGYLHEVKDQSAAMQAIVDYSHRVTSVWEIPQAVAHAFAAMRTGRPRPVHLEIPLDLLDQQAAVRPAAQVPVPSQEPDPRQLARAADALESAKRPGVVVGGGCRGAAAEVLRLVEMLDAPVVTTANGKGTVPEDHPLALGAGLHHAPVADFIADCDVVLAVGTELAPSDLWNGPLRTTGALVRIDIDQEQMTRNASADVAVVADARRALAELPKLIHRTDADQQRGRAAHWRGAIRNASQVEGRAWRSIVAALGDAVGRNGAIAGDSAKVCYYGVLSNWPACAPASFLYPTGLGTLGYGLPAAIGAKIGRPDAHVVAVHGDGGIMFSVAELAAAASAGLALPVVIVDNGGYGEIRDEMRNRGDAPLGVDLGHPDFPGLARSMGCHGVHVDDHSELAAAVRQAFTAERPTLIHITEQNEDDG